MPRTLHEYAIRLKMIQLIRTSAIELNGVNQNYDCECAGLRAIFTDPRAVPATVNKSQSY